MASDKFEKTPVICPDCGEHSKVYFGLDENGRRDGYEAVCPKCKGRAFELSIFGMSQMCQVLAMETAKLKFRVSHLESKSVED